MSREDKVSFLVEDDVDYILHTADGKDFLRILLSIGNLGYDRMTDAELQEEYESRLGKPD